MDDVEVDGREKHCVSCQSSTAPLNCYVLRCLHTVCASCVESAKEENVVCAHCDLSTSLEQLRKRLLYLNDEFSRCDCIDKGLVTSRCVECDEFLCLACEIAHRRVKLSRNHQLVKICADNLGVVSETISFCKTCNQKTEPSCETSSHVILKFLPVSVEEDQYKTGNAIDGEYLKNLREKIGGYVEHIAHCRKEEISVVLNQINNAVKVDMCNIDNEKIIVHSRNLQKQIISFSAMSHFSEIAVPMLDEAQNILLERLDQKYVANAKMDDLNSMKSHILSILNAISVSSSPEYGTPNGPDAGSNERQGELGPVGKIIQNSFDAKKSFITPAGTENSSSNGEEIPMDVGTAIMKLDYVGPATSAEPDTLDPNQPSSLCGSKKRKRSFHVATDKSTPPLRLKLRLTGIDGLTTENDSVQTENRQNPVDMNNIRNEELKVENAAKEPSKELNLDKEESINILDVSGASSTSFIVVDPVMEKENLERRQVNNHNETKSSTQAQVGNDEDEKEWDSFCSVCGKSDQPLAHCHATSCLRSFHFDHHVPPVFHGNDKFVCSLCDDISVYMTADDMQSNEQRKSAKMTKYEKKAAEQILLKLYCDPDSMLLGYHEDCHAALLIKEITLSYIRDRLISTTFPRTSSSSSIDSSGPLMSTPKNPGAVLHLDATPNAISRLPTRPKYDRIEAFIFDMNQLFVESFKRYGDQSTYMQQCEQMASIYMKAVNELLPLYRHHVDLSMPNERNLRKRRGTKVQSDFEISK